MLRLPNTCSRAVPGAALARKCGCGSVETAATAAIVVSTTAVPIAKKREAILALPLPAHVCLKD
jgi:hypothetical protein